MFDLQKHKSQWFASNALGSIWQVPGQSPPGSSFRGFDFPELWCPHNWVTVSMERHRVTHETTESDAQVPWNGTE